VHPEALAAVLVVAVVVAHPEGVIHRAVSEGVAGIGTAATPRAVGGQVEA
jgi:hypothetical protein